MLFHIQIPVLLAFAPTILLQTLISMKDPQEMSYIPAVLSIPFFNSSSSGLIIIDNDKCLCRIVIYEVDVMEKKN